MFALKVNKNSFLKVLTSFAALSLLAGCASDKSTASLSAIAAAAASQDSSRAGVAPAAKSEAVEVSYDFLAKEDLRVKTVNLGVVSAEDLLIPQGTALKVIQTKMDETLGTLVRMGIKADAEGKLPGDVWLLLDDTLLLALQTKEAVATQE